MPGPLLTPAWAHSLPDFHISHSDLSLGLSSVEEGHPEHYLLHFFVLSERDSRGSCIWKRAGVWVALSKDQEGPDPKNLEEDPGVLTQPVLCRSHIKEVLIPALKHNPLQFCHSEAGEVLRIWLLFSFALTAWSPNCSSGSSLAGSKGHRKVLILEPRT